jgi:hypothetical protein
LIRARPARADHLEKVREHSLLKEYEMYQTAVGCIHHFRTEDVRANKAFTGIMAFAKRLLDEALQKD